MGKSTKDVINHFLILEPNFLLRNSGITLSHVITELQF